MAYVLNGKASHSLLASYNFERQPIDEFTVNQAYNRFQNRIAFRKPPATEAPDASIELGYRYPRGGAFVSDDTAILTEVLYDDPALPSAAPGSRFPHSWIEDTTDPGRTISSIDLVKRNFLLITIDHDSPWIVAASKSLVKVDAYALSAVSSPFRDPSGDVERKCRLKQGEAILVRPDGFIAWRGARLDNGHETKLREGFEAILKWRRNEM